MAQTVTALRALILRSLGVISTTVTPHSEYVSEVFSLVQLKSPAASTSPVQCYPK